MSAKLNIKIIQGTTFRQVLRWESGTKVYVPITNITKSAPTVITAPGIAVPLGWRVKITNVAGMKEINSDEVYHVVSDINNDDITINLLNSLGYTAYTSGGVVEYNAPVPLTGYTARMHIRPKLKSETILEELTTEDGQILIDTNYNTVTILLSDTVTAAFDFNSAVYSLEMVKGNEVEQLVYGNITLEKEITRD